MQKGAYIPVVYGLLPDKSTETYLKFFVEVGKFSDSMFTGEYCFAYIWPWLFKKGNEIQLNSIETTLFCNCPTTV